MSVLKRAILYIFRKRGKTAGLFLLLWIMAVFLPCCFAVLDASRSLSREIRTSIGAAFYIRANTQVSVMEGGETQVSQGTTHISQSEIDAIMDMGGLKYCNPINYGFAKSDSLDFIPGEKHSEESNMGKITALKYSALAPAFAEEQAVLTEGAAITDGDKGKIIISEQLAKRNNLSVGDVISLTHAKLGEVGGEYVDEIPNKTTFVEVQVCGIYRLTTEDKSIAPTAAIADNEIYASLDVLDGLKESESGVYTGEVGFYMTDPARLGELVHKVHQLPEIDWTTHFIRTNDFSYSKIRDQLSSIGSLVKMLLVCSSAVSTGVLTLMLILRIRGRTQEAGILLAAGISKRQIAGQFLLEVLAVMIVALVFACAVCPGVTRMLGNSIFGELQPHLLNEETLAAGIDSGAMIGNNLQTDITEQLIIYICQIMAVTVSTLISCIVMVRWSPKDLLTKMS